MANHTEKVRAHAEEKLREERKRVRTRPELIKLYKRFLKIEEHRIKMMHRAGAGGLEIAQRRADLLDIVLKNLLAEALETLDSPPSDAHPITLVATGGYGRALLNPGSDVDLLFLNKTSAKTLPKEITGVIEQILYMLWDTGFKVGHAVRSIKETTKLANEDNQTKSSIIEARLITGDQELFDTFLTRFHKACIEGHEKAYLQDRMRDLRSRYAKHLNTVYVQEPQVKNGCGALRDYHNALWVGYVKRGARTLRQLMEQKILTGRALHQMEKAYDFLHRVRNELHYSERRATDILTLRLQGVVSENLGYKEKNVLKRTEEFMRDYYRHTREMFRHSTSLMERFELEQEDTKGKGIISFLARRDTKEERFDGFVSRNGHLYPEGASIFEDDPSRIMRLFQHAQQRHLKLSPQMRQLVKRNWSLIDKSFRYKKTVRDTFAAILSRKGDVARTLRLMHRSGVLGRYLPEFGALDCLVQHEFFHRYTADEHTLTCIDKLDELSDADNPKTAFFQELFHNIEDPFVLYLALVMHDTGRAANVRHHEDASAMLATRVCNRLKVPLARRRLIMFLVDHHLTFWRTATTKNIDDPSVVSEFASIVKKRHYLDTLFLLTYVDSKGTNEEAWSDWKEMLMRQLYQSTILYLEDKTAFDSQAQAQDNADRKTDVLKGLPEEFAPDVDAHFEHMPARYFRLRDPKSIILHIKEFRRFFSKVVAASPSDSKGALLPRYRWIASQETGSSELLVTCWNRGGLLSTVAGALASHQINILGADLFLRSDDVVLNSFRVCTTDFEPVTSDKVRKGIESLINAHLMGDSIEFSQLIAESSTKEDPKNRKEHSEPIEIPQRAFVTNDANPDYTVIELQALDRIGLLYDVFRTVNESGYDTTYARISTEKGAAIDTLYITDQRGDKIPGGQAITDLETELSKILKEDSV